MALTVQTMYDFDAQPGSGELNLRIGDLLTVTRQDVGDGWWEGMNSNGQQGLFPESYVQVVSSAPPPMPPPPLPQGYGSPAHPTASPSSSAGGWGAQNGSTITTQPSRPPMRTESEDAFEDDWSDDDSQTQGKKKKGRRRRAQSMYVPHDEKENDCNNDSAVAHLLSMSHLLINRRRSSGQNDQHRSSVLSSDSALASVVKSLASQKSVDKPQRRDSSGDEIEDRQTRSYHEPPQGGPASRTRSDTEDSRASSVDRELDGREEPTSYSASTYGSTHGRGTSSGDVSSRATVRKNINRFSNFVKSGTEAYILNAIKITSQPAEKHEIIDGPDGPQWTPISQPYTCVVDKPKKESKFKGIKSFIAYQLTPSFNGIQVSRRYKHFDWLHERLAEKYSILSIPPLPEKQVSGKFEEDLIEHRKNILQIWVDKICRHPVLSRSDVWIHYVTCTDDKKWKQGKRKAEKDEYTGGNFFMSITVPPKPIDQTEVDNQVEAFSRMSKSLDDSVKGLFERAHDSAKKMAGPQKREFQKMAYAFRGLAESFTLDTSPHNQKITEAMRHTADCYHYIGDLCEHQPKKDLELLMDSLYVYKGILGTVPDSVNVHRSAMGKLRDHEKLSQEGKISQGEAETVRTRVDTISYAVMAEINHFNRERVTDFKSTMTEFLQNQIEFYQQITTHLQGALHEFQTA